MELESIQDRYVQVLRSYLEHVTPHHPGRLQELFARIPEVRTRFYFQLDGSTTNEIKKKEFRSNFVARYIIVPK